MFTYRAAQSNTEVAEERLEHAIARLDIEREDIAAKVAVFRERLPGFGRRSSATSRIDVKMTLSGSALALIASGQYIAGAAWPPIFDRLIDNYGWRATMIGFALFRSR